MKQSVARLRVRTQWSGMLKTTFLLLLLFNWSCAPAQTPDEATLIKEAGDRLNNRSATVSSILTDKRYLPVHPATGFRDLIKAHSNTEVLMISTADEPGRKISVLGTIKDQNGKPITGALVYLYQTDAKGWYSASSPHVGGNSGDQQHARLFGYVKTDANGKFEFHTIKPSGYPQSDLPAHIHVHVWADGYSSFVNEFLFDDDERLVGEIREQAVRNHFMISKPEKAISPFEQLFTYSIQLNKE